MKRIITAVILTAFLFAVGACSGIKVDGSYSAAIDATPDADNLPRSAELIVPVHLDLTEGAYKLYVEADEVEKAAIDFVDEAGSVVYQASDSEGGILYEGSYEVKKGVVSFTGDLEFSGVLSDIGITIADFGDGVLSAYSNVLFVKSAETAVAEVV